MKVRLYQSLHFVLVIHCIYDIRLDQWLTVTSISPLVKTEQRVNISRPLVELRPLVEKFDQRSKAGEKISEEIIFVN